MSATIIDGRQIANQIKSELAGVVTAMHKQGIVPGLAVILAGEDTASQLYVKNKQKACHELGLRSWVYTYPAGEAEAEIMTKIQELNADVQVHGILVQLPLPEHINKQRLVEAIDPRKDVDCFHPYNFGRLALGQETLSPCTPSGIVELLKRSDIAVGGKHCVVVGRSNLVGKPLFLMLLQDHATVTICHSQTKNLPRICQQADILISAAGKAGLITRDMLKSGAVVVDVGINRDANGKLVGDVAYEEVKEIAGMITPVPGGVGPMTIAMLMKNVIQAARNCHKG